MTRISSRALTPLCCSALALSATAAFSPALADEQDGPASVSSASESSDAIIVTARRKEERLTDVPVSVAVYSPQLLAERGVTNIQELATLTPGLAVTSGATGGRNRPAFELRGIFAADTLGPQDQAIGIYVNEIYVARPNGTAQTFYDLENVQTLFGPQGTLFGRNSTAGAILVTTAKPTDAFEGKFSVGYGNYDRVSLEGMINVPLAERARLRLAGGQRLGVLAVDPSSPRSGGAILGDRVRMDDLVDDPGLYIRSLGSRRTGDGLADNLPEMLDLMDAFEFDEVLLETVGVGQAEHAVRAQVDTVVLVLLPDSGDAVQAMKAGIMEMADIFVVHKCDLPGAQRAATDLQRVAALRPPAPQAWVPPILLTSCQQPGTVAALSQAIDRHQAWRALHAPDAGLARARYRLRRLIERRVARFVAAQDASFFQQSLPAQADAALRAAAPREEV